VSAQLGYGDLSGLPTLAATDAGSSHHFLTSYTSTTGAFTDARPAVADLSDTPAAAQVLAGPATGVAATATFRALAATDIPSLSGTYLPLGGGTMTGILNITSGIALDWNSDTGLSRLGIASLAIGNGTAADYSGSLKLANLTVTSAAGGYPVQLTVTNTNPIGSANFSVINNVSSYMTFQMNGSGEYFKNIAGLAVGNPSFTYTPYAVWTDNSVSTGGTSPIYFLSGGYGVTPQLSVLSSGVVAIGGTGSLNAGVVNDTGISRLGAASLAIGNGTAADYSGSLKLTTLTLAGKIGTYNGVATVNEGVAPILAAPARLTSQTAAQSAVNIVASALAGMYRISYCASITTASDISSVLGGANGFAVTFTDPQDSVAKTSNPTTPMISAANTTGTTVSGALYAYAKAGTAITYNFGYTDSHTTTAMAYNIAVYAEYLG
jgi:hypothetical protein